MNFTRTLIAAALVTIGSTSFAQAIIDQNRALAGNVTPGDTAGFPVTISQPGSYKLTSNLFVPAGQGGIVITADNVYIDLNGFSITAPGKCTRSQNYKVTCTGLSQGILSTNRIEVRNGAIEGFSAGLTLYNGVVERVSVRHNGQGIVGVNGGNNVKVSNSTAEMNRWGFNLNAGFIENSQAYFNEAGMFGTNSKWLVIRDSFAHSNEIGMANAAIRGSRASQNKIDLEGTVAY